MKGLCRHTKYSHLGEEVRTGGDVRFSNKTLKVHLGDGPGKRSQTGVCLPDKQEALEPIPGTATKEMEGQRKEQLEGNKRTGEALK